MESLRRLSDTLKTVVNDSVPVVRVGTQQSFPSALQAARSKHSLGALLQDRIDSGIAAGRERAESIKEYVTSDEVCVGMQSSAFCSRYFLVPSDAATRRCHQATGV
jgi:hypothetical protein